LIARYTRPAMGRIWSEENKFRTWLKVEIAATDTLSEAGLVPRDLSAMRSAPSGCRFSTTVWWNWWTAQ